MDTSNSGDELLYYWQAYYNKSIHLKPLVVQLYNSYRSAAENEDENEDTTKTKETYTNVYFTLLPLYEVIYTHLRSQLRNRYPGVINNNYIPAHLLGMSQGKWAGLYSWSRPYPETQSLSIKQALISKGYTVKKMAETAEDLFASMGMRKAPRSFFEKSQFEKPEIRNVSCDSKALDFHFNHKYRISMCGKVDDLNFYKIHKLMAEVQYYMQYGHQPYLYQSGPDGFVSGVSEAIKMASQTPQYLKTIGLLPNYETNEKQETNALYKVALETCFDLSYHLAYALWYDEAYYKNIPESQWNSEYWKLQKRYRGLAPPVKRSEEFDDYLMESITGNYRVVNGSVFKFQFFEALCRAAGTKDKLHQCVFHNSKAAGAKLAAMLKLGKTKPYRDALQELTGQRELNATSVQEYFRPLIKALKEKNKGECYGWGADWPADVLKTLPTPRCAMA